MRKILLSLSLLIAITFTFNGCKFTEKTTNQSSNETISSEENLFNVKVTLPSVFFKGTEKSTIVSEGKARGIHDVTVNEDGSVTCTMDEKTHKALLVEIKKAVDGAIEETLEDKNTYPSFYKIEYKDDLTEFYIYVDASKYSDFESLSALVFYMSGNLYQSMNFVEASNINTKVNFINRDTNEVIEIGNSSEIGENNN